MKFEIQVQGEWTFYLASTTEIYHLSFGFSRSFIDIYKKSYLLADENWRKNKNMFWAIIDVNMQK